MTVAHKLVELSPGELNEMNALHRPMSLQIVRLESELEEFGAGDLQPWFASYLRGSVTLRDLLVRAAGLPPGVVSSLEERLADAIAYAYRWAINELSELRRALSDRSGPRAKSIPADALSVFYDLSRLCSSSGSADGQQMVKTLRDIDDVLYRLITVRDRLERVIASRSR